jgi:cytochrome bd ubiquinol oxidase subunit II
MDLPLLSALFLLFALTLYVVLDGFDLGVGVLLFAQRDQTVRDRMVDAIAPTWDGNETWLIMAGITLLAGFPLAYSVLLPAFYLPLVAMLLSLGLRGVSFEFRHHSAHWRRRWDAVFGGGSLVAALAQGAIVGGLIQGVRIERETFAGGPTDVFTPFCVLTGATVLAGYATLGAGWLRLKGEEATRSFAGARLRWLALAFLGLTIVTSIAAVNVQPELAATWGRHPVALSLLTLAFASCAGLIAWAARRDDVADGVAFALAMAMVLSGMASLGLAFFPNVIPFKISLWQAASGTASHVFLLIGAGLVTPVVLGYSAFAYSVFRGKTPAEGWEP